jgi:flagellar biosynthesis protein FlhB
MADTPDKDQQTEAPTEKRKSDAIDKGDILQSKELGAALIMVAGAGWIALGGPMFVDACQTLLTAGLTVDRAEAMNFEVGQTAQQLVGLALLPLALLMGGAMAASIGSSALIGSLGFRGKLLAFKGNRINPVSGVKRMFGLQGLIELAKSIAKTVVFGALGYWFLSGKLPEILSLAGADVKVATTSIGNMLSWAILVFAGGFAVIALIDVPAQRFQRNARLRMTKHELKEELRQSEGAPELKHMQRRRQQEMLMGSARKAVTEATVVLTNPTHFAVALRYNPEKDHAPVVVARGRGETARAIRELAAENAVPTLEYPQLARAIYYTSRAGQIVASDLYVAVATVLAFVFHLERAMAEGISQPSVVVPENKCFDEFGALSGGGYPKRPNSP